MVDKLVSEALRAQEADKTAAIVRASCEPLPSPDDAENFGAFFDRFADAKVILLGEATHGTSQFYRARAAITRRLIEKHGFSIVAVEGDWPDAARIDRHVRHRAHEPSSKEAFARFPTWMWRNVEMHDFVEWLRAHNEKLPAHARTRFCGLDIYSLGTSITAVLSYLDRVDPQEAKTARRRYGCLTPWQDEPARYGRAALYLDKSPCEDGVVAELRALLDKRLEYVRSDGEFFSTRRRTQEWCGPRNITIGSCIAAQQNRGTCAIAICSIRWCGCLMRVATMRKQSCGRIIRISATPQRAMGCHGEVISRSRGLADLDAELEQLAVDAGGAPERVSQAHLADQIADLGAHRGRP